MSTGQNFHEAGGHFIHINSSSRRRITIAYTRESGTIRYGAVIFRPLSRTDRFTKEMNRQHAVERYETCPVIMADDPSWTSKQRNRRIRHALTVNGCHS